MNNFEFHVEGFLLYCTSKNLSRKTLASYEQALKLFGMYLQTEFSISEVDTIQSTHIRLYIKHLRERGKYTVSIDVKKEEINHPKHRTDYKKDISLTTIANYVRNIKVFFNWLYSVEREIRKNPVEKLENPKIDRKIKKTLAVEEIKQVLGTFDTTTFHGYRNYLITRLLLDTGMRVGECLSLIPEHIDFKHKSIIIVSPKNKKQRYVYFSPKIARELKQWLKYKDRYSESSYLFPTNRGTQLTIRNFEKALRDAGEGLIYQSIAIN